MFTSTGKKQSTAAIAIFEPLSIPNQAIAIGAKAMIGMAFAAMKYGISAVPSGRKRASRSAASDRGGAAGDEAPERLLEREPARGPQRRALVPEP